MMETLNDVRWVLEYITELYDEGKLSRIEWENLFDSLLSGE